MRLWRTIGPKGEEYMRRIASRGGLASGVTRHKKKVAKIRAAEHGIEPMPAFSCRVVQAPEPFLWFT